MKTSSPFIRTALFALAFSFLFLSRPSEAAPLYPAQENYSLYLYNALENNYSVEQLLNNQLLPREELALATETKSGTDSISPEEKARLEEKRAKEDYKDLLIKKEKALSDSEKALKSATAKGNLRNVVLGTNVGSLEFQLVQIKGLASALNSLIPKISDVSLKLEIKEQIEALEENQAQLEALLSQKSEGFSFLGWLVATL